MSGLLITDTTCLIALDGLTGWTFCPVSTTRRCHPPYFASLAGSQRGSTRSNPKTRPGRYSTRSFGCRRGRGHRSSATSPTRFFSSTRLAGAAWPWALVFGSSTRSTPSSTVPVRWSTSRTARSLGVQGGAARQRRRARRREERMAERRRGEPGWQSTRLYCKRACLGEDLPGAASRTYSALMRRTVATAPARCQASDVDTRREGRAAEVDAVRASLEPPRSRVSTRRRARRRRRGPRPRQPGGRSGVWRCTERVG